MGEGEHIAVGFVVGIEDVEVTIGGVDADAVGEVCDGGDEGEVFDGAVGVDDHPSERTVGEGIVAIDFTIVYIHF